MTETTSHFFATPDPDAPPSGKKQKQLDEKERKLAWDFHYGPLSKEHVCCACDVTKMIRNDKGSWQAAHIVARNYLDDPTLANNVLYLIPCCPGCNLEMGTTCLFNVLWDRGKGTAIKQIAERIYDYYAQMNPQHLLFYEKLMWKLIRGLFGSERHRIGGGIAVRNEERLYRMLMLHQLQLLEGTVSEHLAKIKQSTALMERLLLEANRPGHGGPKDKSVWA